MGYYLIFGQIYRIREVVRLFKSLHQFDSDSHKRLTEQIHRMAVAFDGFEQKILSHSYTTLKHSDIEEAKVDRDAFQKMGDYLVSNSDQVFAGVPLSAGDGIKALTDEEYEEIFKNFGDKQKKSMTLRVEKKKSYYSTLRCDNLE